MQAVDDIIKFNPSWAVAKSLPPALTANAAHPSRIRIIVHPSPVPNVYKDVLNLTPHLFDNHFSVHLVLHLSAALDSRDYYSLERCAIKPAYTEPDDTGERVMPSRQPEYWMRQPDTLRSSSAFNDALTRWRSDVPVSDFPIFLYSSTIALTFLLSVSGHLCSTNLQDTLLTITRLLHQTSELCMSDRANHPIAAYQFFASLAHVQQAGSHVPWQERTMVAAMTLPNKTSVEDLEEGRKVVIGLIYALIDSRRFRDGDYHELPDSRGNLDPVEDDQ